VKFFLPDFNKLPYLLRLQGEDHHSKSNQMNYCNHNNNNKHKYQAKVLDLKIYFRFLSSVKRSLHTAENYEQILAFCVSIFLAIGQSVLLHSKLHQ
jgi:hypothetical protein